MYLCFGSYANVLKLCTLDPVSQRELVCSLVHTIDPDEQYSNPATHGSTVSRLFNCKSNFPMSGGSSHAPGQALTAIMTLIKDIDTVDLAPIFGSDIIRLLGEDKKELAVLMLIDILKKDPTTEDRRRSFQKYMLMSLDEFLERDTFDLKTFLAGLFLYCLVTGKNNCPEGRQTLEVIRDSSYLSSFADKRGSIQLLRAPDSEIFGFNYPFIKAGTDINIDHAIISPADIILSQRPGRASRYISKEKRREYMWEISRGDLSYAAPEFVLEYRVYAKALADKFRTTKTLLSNDTPRPFCDIYVCNNLGIGNMDKEQTSRLFTYIDHLKESPSPQLTKHYNLERDGSRFYHTLQTVIQNVTAKKLGVISRYVILTGTGGLGKSMMMQHLLLSTAAEVNDKGIIPLFLSLKDMHSDYDTLLDHIYAQNSGLLEKDKETLSKHLQEGGFIILMDGLDEIPSEHLAKFDQMLDHFIDKHPNNQYIISSRPYTNFVSYRRFTVLEVLPLDKPQAAELIRKTNFRPDKPEIMEKFLKALDTKLFETHHGFAENPLLLTIMLMTFEQFADIPSKMHIFYREAYQALAIRHDANKGAYKRQLKTGLDPEQFSDLLAEFCARTYTDEAYDHTWDELDNYFRKLMIRKERPSDQVTTQNFIDDLCHGLCLMYLDNGRYHYFHRSFQEYFCALYFSREKDKKLEKVGQLFEKRAKGRQDDDYKAFDMLYDMIPKKVEEYIFIPYLGSLLKDHTGKLGYFRFLAKVYREVSFDVGEVLNDTVNVPYSYLYRFLTKKNGLLHTSEYGKEMARPEPPFSDNFIAMRYVKVCFADKPYEERENADHEIIAETDLSPAYQKKYGDPEVVGYIATYDIDDLIADGDIDEAYEQFFSDSEFPLKVEFENVRKYYEDLVKQAQDEDNREGLFD